MKRWILCLAFILVLGFIVVPAYQAYRSGLLSLPDLPDGAFTLSFKNGLRAIILDAEVPEGTDGTGWKYNRSLSITNRDRRYFGVPREVQPWFADAWSWCRPPTEEEKAGLSQMSEEIRRSVQNARFEAVCRINVDGTEVVRGLIFSVPRL